MVTDVTVEANVEAVVARWLLQTPVAADHRKAVGRDRRANTRARIVEAAIMVYAEKGPDTPVIDDFVKAARMSRGTFYNHFSTTAELLDATVDWFESRLIGTIFDTVQRYPELDAKAAVAMRLHLHWITSDPPLCAFFARMPRIVEVGRRDARIRIRKAVTAGVFRVVDIGAVCDVVFGSLSETIRRVAVDPTSPPRCDEVVRILLSCLGVSRVRIEELMALPLPKIPVPVRLTDMPGAPRFSAR